MRNQHGDRLAQHGGFGFNATNTPAQHAQAIDHGGMGIRADQGIRVGLARAVIVGTEYHPREVFKIHLMNDAGIRRNHLEIRKGLLAPFKKTVAFPVTLIFQFTVQIHGLVRSKAVDLDRVINDQLRRLQWIDPVRITTQLFHGITHRGQVHNGRYTGKVLH